MRNIIALIIILLSLSPLNGQNTMSLPDSAGQQAANVNGDDCDENKAFQNLYFAAIAKLDTYMSVGGNKDSLFWQPLAFISLYATVSYNSILNYLGTYTDYNYQKDRHYWLAWYKKHKCGDIQIKQSEREFILLPREDWYQGYFSLPGLSIAPSPIELKVKELQPIAK